MQRKLFTSITLPAILLLAACGGDDKRIDDALRQDLSLAAQTNPYQQFVSPMEQGYPYGTYPGAYAGSAAPGGYYPAAARAPSTTRTIYRAPASTGTTQRTRIVKNTKRDAIIGAVAGGAIGAVTTRDRLKGAVIGAAAGGILGAVIGNNVDKKRVPYP